jgi:hypothetical protein
MDLGSHQLIPMLPALVSCPVPDGFSPHPHTRYRNRTGAFVIECTKECIMVACEEVQLNLVPPEVQGKNENIVVRAQSHEEGSKGNERLLRIHSQEIKGIKDVTLDLGAKFDKLIHVINEVINICILAHCSFKVHLNILSSTSRCPNSVSFEYVRQVSATLKQSVNSFGIRIIFRTPLGAVCICTQCIFSSLCPSVCRQITSQLYRF